MATEKEKKRAREFYHALKHDPVKWAAYKEKTRIYREKNKDVLAKKQKEKIKRMRAEHPEILKSYRDRWYWKNVATHLAKKTAYRTANPEQHREYGKRYYKAHPEHREKRLAWTRRWYKNNVERMRIKSRLRGVAVRTAQPVWANEVAMEVFYAEAVRLSRHTGIKFDVDHIVPIKGANVCGLHWEGNLQILSAFANRQKKNRFIDPNELRR